MMFGLIQWIFIKQLLCVQKVTRKAWKNYIFKNMV